MRLRAAFIKRLALLAVLLGGSAGAETDPVATAERAAELIEQAGFALLEADGARDRVEALTQTVRAYEEGLLALREGVRQAALRERTILLVFDAERDRLARLLAVLQSIEGTAAPLLLMHPEGPLGTARSGMIVSEVAPAVAAEAQALRRQLEELARLRDIQDGAVAQLSAALNRAQEARTQLSQAIADRRSLPENFTEDATAMAELIASVDSLDRLADVLSTAPLPQDELPDFEAARGTLVLPVLGTVLRRFGEGDAAGVERPGLVIAARPRAIVTSPWPASVRYAGPLLDYGNVIILEPEGAYLLVIAGLGTLYVEPGDLLAFEAPLGLMPGDGEAETGALIISSQEGSSATLSETLYIEVRDNGRPVDPAEWFALGGP